MKQVNIALARKNLISSIEATRRELDETIQLLRNKADSPSLDGFMGDKQDYMKILLTAMPIHADTCPFCIENGYDVNMRAACDKCAYGATYGICGGGSNGKPSPWNKLRQTIWEVNEKINDYWRG